MNYCGCTSDAIPMRFSGDSQSACAATGRANLGERAPGQCHHPATIRIRSPSERLHHRSAHACILPYGPSLPAVSFFARVSAVFSLYSLPGASFSLFVSFCMHIRLLTETIVPIRLGDIVEQSLLRHLHNAVLQEDDSLKWVSEEIVFAPTQFVVISNVAYAW